MLVKKRTKKIFISVLAAATIYTSTGPVFANQIVVTMPQTIYESTDSQNLSSGVVHEKIQKFTHAGWWNINVIRIDLTNQYTELKGLFNPNGIPNRDKVSSMVDKSGAIAGINGDYFNYQPLPFSLGVLISDGEVISSPNHLPTLSITNSNQAIIDYFDKTMVATNMYKGTQSTITYVNKLSTYMDSITLLNKHWGQKSIGNRFHNDLVEVLVVDGIVQEKRKGGAPFDIPKTGDAYVLAVRNTTLDHFEAGDSVNLQLSTTPNVESLKFAIGGGSIILKNGELSLTDINSKGDAPRTGIGVNKDSTELILVTIDGRDTSFNGVSQEMFGAILRDLGAYNAINLDGGGSTTMAIKPKDEEKSIVVNKPSEGTERLVVNGVGVFSDAPIGELSYLKLTTDDDQMFIETTRAIKVKGYDENHNPKDLDESKIKLSVSGVEGEFEGNKFKATSSGNGKIIAEYDGVVGEMNIEVLGPVIDLATDTTRINVEPNSQHKIGEFYGKDKNGTKAKIYTEDVVFNVLGGIGEIKDGIFNSTDQVVSGAISAYVGNSVENILVSIGSQGKLVHGFEQLEGFNFTSYPSIVTGNVTLSDESHEGNHSLSLNYNFTQGTNTRAAYANFTPNGATGLKLPEQPKKLGLWVKGDGSGTWLRGALKDASGKEHLIDFVKTLDSTEWQYVTANVPNNVSYPVTLEKIYVAETDSLKKPSGSILLDGLTAYYPSPIGNMELPTPTVVKDELETQQAVGENGFSFKVAANTLIDGTNAYNVTKQNDVLLININSSKSGIRATNANQWTTLIKDLETRSETSFVLSLPTSIFGSNGFTDKLEAELLHSKLVEAKERGKNIFVVHGGNSTGSELIDGIRYISLDTVQKKNEVQFVVNGDIITYQISK